MAKPLSFYLGLRYVRSRHGSGFSAFISASSTIGIALGVMVLIVVLSVMNGFERELTNKLLSIVPHIELTSVNEPIKHWPKSVKRITEQEEVLAVAPVIKMTGMLQHRKALKAVEVRAVNPLLEQQVSSIHQYISAGEWEGLLRLKSGIVLGSGVAKKLSVKLGDKLQLLLPSPSDNGDFKNTFTAPVTHHVEVVGVFTFGGTIDDTLAYISIAQGRAAMNYQEHETQAIRIKTSDVFNARSLARKIAHNFEHYVYISDWTRTQGHIFNDIQLVKMVMFIVLILVIGVASFNIVSTLIMAVNEKKGDIAILKTMGAKSSTIMMTFVIQGAVNGILGCLVGATLGILTAENISNIMFQLEQFFKVELLSSDVYFINYLPSLLHWNDVYITIVVALVLSLIATIYPAWKATKIEPARVLGQI